MYFGSTKREYILTTHVKKARNLNTQLASYIYAVGSRVPKISKNGKQYISSDQTSLRTVEFRNRKLATVRKRRNLPTSDSIPIMHESSVMVACEVLSKTSPA